MDDDADDLKEAKYLRSNDFLRLTQASDDWLVEDLIEANALIGLAGLPATAKSYLALDLADCVSRGEPWLGIFPTQKGKVVYISLEMRAGDEKKRLLARGHTEVEGTDIFIKRPADFDISTPEKIKVWRKEIAQYDPSLVVIDSILPAINFGSDISPAKIREKLTPLRKMAQKLCAILYILHNGTNNQLRGGQQWRANSETIIDVRAKENLPNRNLRQHIVIAGRSTGMSQIVVDMDSETKIFRLVGSTQEEYVSQADKEAQLRKEMTKFLPIARAILLTQDAKATSSEIADASGISINVVRDILVVMRARRMVEDSGEREGAKRHIIRWCLTDKMDAFTRTNSDLSTVDFAAAAKMFAIWDEREPEHKEDRID